MKKIFSLFLIVVIFALMTGCSTNVPNDSSSTTQKPADATEATNVEDPTEAAATEEPTEAPEATEKSEMGYEVTYSNAIVYTDSIGTNWVHAVVQVENTGSEPIYFSGSTLDLEDADEHLVTTLEMISAYPEVLNPGECALLVEDTTLDKDPGADTLTVIPHLQVSKAKIECIRFETSEEELYTADYLGLKLKGRVKNTSDETQKMVYVIANLYDADHHGIGQLMTIITNDLAAGEKIGFDLTSLSMPDSINEESVASFEVFAFPLQYQFDW